MKWDTYKQEFETLGEYFSHRKRLILCGVIYGLADLYERIAFLKPDVVYADEQLAGEQLGTSQILTYTQARELLKEENSIMVVFGAGKSKTQQDLCRQLAADGAAFRQDFFLAEEFKEYLSLWCLYAYGKCYIELVGHQINWACTLHCKYCGESIPYIHSKKNPDAAQLKDELEKLFAKVDYIHVYDCTSAETFLASDVLAELQEFLLETYGDRVGSVSFTTNATVIPSERIFKLLSKYPDKIHVRTSCYDTLPGWKEKFAALAESFAEHGCRLEPQYNGRWIDFGFRTTCLNISEEEMVQYFDRCKNNCRRYVNGKYYWCGQGHNATMAFYPDLQEEALDFYDETLTKKQIVAYNGKLLQKGYLEICRHCKGYTNMNFDYIPVAEQMNRF